jgi:hypothetical protein
MFILKREFIIMSLFVSVTPHFSSNIWRNKVGGQIKNTPIISVLNKIAVFMSFLIEYYK